MAGMTGDSQAGWICRKECITGASHGSGEIAEQSHPEEEHKYRGGGINKDETDMNGGGTLSQGSENHGIRGCCAGQLHAVGKLIRRNAMQHQLTGVSVFPFVALQRHGPQAITNKRKRQNGEQNQSAIEIKQQALLARLRPLDMDRCVHPVESATESVLSPPAEIAAFLGSRRKFGLPEPLTSAVQRSCREGINDDLQHRGSTSVEHYVLPSPSSRRDERLVNLVKRSGDDGDEHAKHRPLHAPEVVQVKPPGSQQHRREPIAIGVP